MDSNSYDIFRKHPDGMWVWVESVKDLQTAREHLEQLPCSLQQNIWQLIKTHRKSWPRRAAALQNPEGGG